MPNKIIMLNKKPKNYIVIYIIFITLLLTSILLSYKIKTYDSKNITGLIECSDTCKISITLQYNEIELLSKNPQIEYLNKKYNIENIEYNEPYLNNNIPYQDIILTSNLNLKETRIINIKIIYNKQRITTKIKNIIMEGD